MQRVQGKQRRGRASKWTKRTVIGAVALMTILVVRDIIVAIVQVGTEWSKSQIQLNTERRLAEGKERTAQAESRQERPAVAPEDVLRQEQSRQQAEAAQAALRQA